MTLNDKFTFHKTLAREATDPLCLLSVFTLAGRRRQHSRRIASRSRGWYVGGWCGLDSGGL